MKTVVGLYETVAKANQVRSALAAQGFDSSDINVIDQTNNNASPTSSFNAGASTGTDETSVGSRIKNFFGSLSGHDEDTHRSYTEGITGGGALVSVDCEDDRAPEVATFLHEQGARDIKGGTGSSNANSTGYGTADAYGSASKTADYAATDRTGKGAISGEQVIPVVAEELEVGKRQVERGGVRVYSRVVSEPVSESVSLHDERVVVDRRAVNRPATDADFNTNPGVIEVNATGEEAVVGKRSRVVEEVLVGKEGSDRTEQVNDTVRHTEIDVENTTAGVTAAGSTSGIRGTRDSDLDR